MCQTIAGLAVIKTDNPVLKSSLFSSCGFKLDEAYWGMVEAAGEYLRCKANIVALGHRKFGKKKKQMDRWKDRKKGSDI